MSLVIIQAHPQAAVAKLDGYDIVVANAAKSVGKKVKVEVARVLPGIAYATLVTRAKEGAVPVTAEGEAEKPTRKPSGKKPGVEGQAEVLDADETDEVDEIDEAAETAEAGAEAGDAPPKKKTRRGSRGGRGRKKAPTIHVPEAENGNGPEPAETSAQEMRQPKIQPRAEEPEVQDAEAQEPDEQEPEAEQPEAGADGAQPDGTPKKRKTRRGSRGGRNRRKKPAAATPAETTESG